jgi:hypothetical protein
MERLVVCGWEHDESALLQALREQAQLETVAVGDQYPARLVRARTATRLACYQHTRQMAHDQAFDALLLGAPDSAEEVATTAAVRGADLLLLGTAWTPMRCMPPPPPPRDTARRWRCCGRACAQPA